MSSADRPLFLPILGILSDRPRPRIVRLRAPDSGWRTPRRSTAPGRSNGNVRSRRENWAGRPDRRSRTLPQIGQRPWIMKQPRSRWTSSWLHRTWKRRRGLSWTTMRTPRPACWLALIGFSPLLVGFASIVGLVETRPLEQDRRSRADLAAELGLGALGADRLGIGLDRFEGLELVFALVADVVVSGHGSTSFPEFNATLWSG